MDNPCDECPINDTCGVSYKKCSDMSYWYYKTITRLRDMIAQNPNIANIPLSLEQPSATSSNIHTEENINE